MLMPIMTAMEIFLSPPLPALLLLDLLPTVQIATMPISQLIPAALKSAITLTITAMRSPMSR